MDIEIEDKNLIRMCEDATYTGGYDIAVVKAFRKRIWSIDAAHDERDLRVPNGNRYEKLTDRDGEHSIRLNDQWRLIFKVETINGAKTAIILGIEDYH